MAQDDKNGDGQSLGEIPGYNADDSGDGFETPPAPAVAAAPGKFFLILFAGVTIAFLVLYYFVFTSPQKEEKIIASSGPQIVAQPDITETPPSPPAPTLPPIPRPNITEEPSAQIPIPPVPVVPTKTPNDQQYVERVRSGIMAFSNTGSGRAKTEDQSEAARDFAAADANLAFSAKAIRASEAEVAKAAPIGNLTAIVAQGKLIHGVLESAVNTQLPGPIRAIVSRDIYAEAGRMRLVPKGSRMIGVYNIELFRGQERVFIIWTRIIRPDGIDIMVASPGADMLGRAGTDGYVDSRFRELFSTAILTSMITIGAASGADAMLGDNGQTTTTQNTDGSTSTTSSNTSAATADSISNISDVSKRIIDGALDFRPVITIDQGTKINIMVNRDLMFPNSLWQQTSFVE